MTEKIVQSLRDSKGARWGALAVVSFTMMTGYYINYVISPLKPLFEEAFGWNSVDFGLWNSAYGWFNVFFLMLIFGGIILDKIGVRFTGLGAAFTMIIGTILQYLAIEGLVPMNDVFFEGTFLEMKSQIFYGALGFAIFGVGVEIAGITVSKVIVKWFKGKELALAMGLEMATARMGTALALALPYPMATVWFGTRSEPALSAPVMLGLGLLVAGFVAFIWYTFMDKKLEASEGADKASEEDEFKVSDIFNILTNKGFWLIALLCVLFYSGVFPFLYYATDLMINKYGVSPDFAGTIPGLLPFGTILLTPIFGSIYDRKGKGATIMLIGSVMLLIAHIIFSIPFINNYVVAIALILFLGVTFSLVPSAMWPSVPKIIPEKQLGTAYALIFWVQNWGLMGMPLLIGWSLEKYGRVADESIKGYHYDYTIPMMIFAATGFLAIIVAIMLKAEDKKKGYGLELPNIQK